MEVVHSIDSVRNSVNEAKNHKKTIGFVPTMGSLHQGHLALLQKSSEVCDVTILSIFVNPTQFGPNEDFDSYPRDLQKDLQLIQNQNIHVDLVFAPTVSEMYPFEHKPQILMPFISQKLCGKTRPTHFDGVALVVSKLLNIVQPSHLFMGQKDFQQTVLVRRLIEEFFFPVELVVVPTVREKDGLAMSSRNVYLSESERKSALILFQTLSEIQKQLETGMKNSEIQELIGFYVSKFVESPVKLDYLEILKTNDLEEISEIVSGLSAVIAIAAFVGKTRLIDNFVVSF